MTNCQGSGSTEAGSYTLINGVTSGSAVAANPDAAFRLPTEDEWYKAASPRSLTARLILPRLPHHPPPRPLPTSDREYTPAQSADTQRPEAH